MHSVADSKWIRPWGRDPTGRRKPRDLERAVPHCGGDRIAHERGGGRYIALGTRAGAGAGAVGPRAGGTSDRGALKRLFTGSAVPGMGAGAPLLIRAWRRDGPRTAR